MLNALNESNLIFIGFMGSGKSSVGREISKRFNKLFLDVDSIIENREDMKISDIFAKHGEIYFRDIERSCAKMVENSIHNSVISVGGGFPTAVQNLQDLGFVIYLDIDFDFMVSELSKYKDEIEKRPLMQNLDMARAIYDSRKDVYKSQADLIIQIKQKNLNDVVDEVEKILIKKIVNFTKGWFLKQHWLNRKFKLDLRVKHEDLFLVILKF